MNIVILDTGCSNLFSVSSAIRRIGYQPIISNQKKIILQADKLFLPGIGTALIAMQQLQKFEIVDLIKSYTRPILGICLGMQLFGTFSEENNGIKTLGIIESKVEYIKNPYLPIPHIGWNQVIIRRNSCLFRDIIDKSYFYFVHSYSMFLCSATIAEVHYGKTFTAAIEYNNFFGVQFHPERSGMIGLQLLKNFLEI